jgi:hypothetical protein
MPHVTKQMLGDAANVSPQTFDTHAVIEEIQREYPQAYTRDLYRFVAHHDPITSLHAEIGRRLLTLPFLRKTRKVPGRNIRGRRSYAQEWERI